MIEMWSRCGAEAKGQWNCRCRVEVFQYRKRDRSRTQTPDKAYLNLNSPRLPCQITNGTSVKPDSRVFLAIEPRTDFQGAFGGSESAKHVLRLL